MVQQGARGILIAPPHRSQASGHIQAVVFHDCI
jgi:hypothetical protein